MAPDEIDARLTKEATTPEARHAWLIEVKPVVDLASVSADRDPEGRREGQGRRRAQGPPGRQGVGGRRQDRLDRCVDRAAVRRPRLDRGHRRRHRSRLPEGPLRGRRSTPRPPSSKAPTARIGSVASPRSRRRRSTPPTRPRSSTTACRSTTTARSSPADVLHDKLQTKIVGDLTGPSHAAPRRGDLRQRGGPEPGRRRDQGPPHPLFAEGRSDRVRRRSRRTTPPGRRPTARPSRPGPGSRTTRTCSTPSPARRATRARRRDRPAAAASCRSSTARAPWTTRSRPRSSRRA